MTPFPKGIRADVAPLIYPRLPTTFSIGVIGTSESYGYTGPTDASFRGHLYNLLTVRAGLNPVFIGPYVNGATPADHMFAIIGSNTTEMIAGAAYDLATTPRFFGTVYKPDLTFIEHGTNNAVAALAATFRADYVALCTYARALYPSTRLVCTRTPIGGDAVRRDYIVNDINTQWDGISSDLQALNIPHVIAKTDVLTWGPDQLASEYPNSLHWTEAAGALKFADGVFPYVLAAAGYHPPW